MVDVLCSLTFSTLLGTVYETSFKKAIAIWEQYTCVDFVERDDEDVYVRLTNFTS